MEKRVYVTGAASGIGKAIVEAFCMDGAKVAFCDVDVVKEIYSANKPMPAFLRRM